MDSPDDGRFGPLPVRRATLDQVLADPAAQLPVDAATRPLNIVAITGCPTGIAHTFMAAEGLAQAARALGHAIKVETQGSVGAQNALSAADKQSRLQQA